MNGKNRTMKRVGMAALIAAVVMAMLGFRASSAFAHEPIVGLWLATVTDTSGNVQWVAWDVWHADGTEAQNDSGPIIIGFVCQGAWKQVGNRTYFLSHPTFVYTGADGHLDDSNSAVIYEKVTVSQDGNSFKGTGSIKGYTGIDPFDPSATLLYTLPVKIKAKRVVPDPNQLSKSESEVPTTD